MLETDEAKEAKIVHKQEIIDRIAEKEGFAANEFSFQSYQSFNKYIFWLDGGAIALTLAFCNSLIGQNHAWNPSYRWMLLHGVASILLSLVTMLIMLTSSGDGYNKIYRANMDYISDGENYEKLLAEQKRMATYTNVLTKIAFFLSIFGLCSLGIFFFTNI